MQALTSEPLDALIAKLDQGDASPRREIVHELGRRGKAGDLRVIPLLVGQLHDAGSYVDEAASDALWSIGEPAVPALIELLRSKSAPSGARSWAARTLMYIGDSRSLPPMIDIIQDTSEDETLRSVVALYLGTMKDVGALEPLTDLVTDRDVPADLRANAATALGQLGDSRVVGPLLDVLTQDDVQFHTPETERELEKLAQLQRTAPKGAQKEIAEMVQRLEKGKSLHQAVLNALRTLRDPRALEPLLSFLRSDDDSLQTSAAAAVSALGEVAVPTLLAALHDTDRLVRIGASKALGFLEDESMIEPLAQAMLRDEDSTVRAAAATSLGYLPGERVSQLLSEALRDEDVSVRAAAARALHYLAASGRADPAVLPALEAVADHDRGVVAGRFVAREAAGRAADRTRRANTGLGPPDGG
jgi:HEAT repeat protein